MRGCCGPPVALPTTAAVHRRSHGRPQEHGPERHGRAPGAPTDPITTDPAVPGRRYRPRGESIRDQRLTPRFTDAELSQIKAAADAAQMTVTRFCALAGVEELDKLQRELFAARNAVNRTGVNLNQAVAALNSTGAPPVWLEHAVARVTRAVAEVDTVVARIHRRLS